MKSLKIRILLSSFLVFAALGLIFSIGLNQYVEKQYYNRKIEKMIQTGNQIRNQLQIAGSDAVAREILDYVGYQFEGRITILDIYADRAMILYENQKYIYNQGKKVKEIKYQDQTALIISTDYPVPNSLWLGYLSQIDETKVAWLEIPVPTIDETLEVFRAYVFRALMLGLLISLIVAYWLAQSITRPVARLNLLAKKIGQLEFREHYQGKRADEIGQLGQTLNEITGILKNTFEDLQNQLSKTRQLDRLRKHFVAQVSHELQTPISIISSYTEALQDGLVSQQEAVEYYDIILDECQKMSKMVKDLLDLSNLQSGLFHYKQESFSLDLLLENLLKKQEWILKSEGKEIASQLEKAIIRGDAFRLEQALANVLSNCIKHAHRKIKLRMWQNEAEIGLTIRNDGDLIAEEDLPYLWDSFYKGRHKKNGTGLGLAIASEIFKAHAIKYQVYNDDINKEVVYQLQIAKKMESTD